MSPCTQLEWWSRTSFIWLIRRRLPGDVNLRSEGVPKFLVLTTSMPSRMPHSGVLIKQGEIFLLNTNLRETIVGG